MGGNKIFHKSLYPQVINNYLTERLNLYKVRARLASAIIHSKAKKCKEPIDYIKLSNEIFQTAPLKYIGWPIKSGQIQFEIETLLKIVKKIKVDRMLEIGSFNGGTLFLFSKMVNSDAQIISLDLPGAQFGLANEVFSRNLFSNFATKKQTIYPIRGNSHSAKSIDVIKGLLHGKQFDFEFIDGDHTYEGVKQDFEMYSPLVRKGGIIAFHDICKHPINSGCHVEKFWNEIKRSYKYEEIIESPNQNWAGIGVLYV